MNQNSVIRIQCPPLKKNRNERIRSLFQSIASWVFSKALEELVQLFGGTISAKRLDERIGELNRFVDVWDFRARQSKSGERWEIKDDVFVLEHEQYIFHRAYQLGLMSIEEPLLSPDYILPLGGARRSNFDRAMLTRRTSDDWGESLKRVVALTGFRPLAEIEYPYLDYAPGAIYEFDAMNAALTIAFSLEEDQYREERGEEENINLQWANREYLKSYKGVRINSLSAPSKDPERRANSLDTFLFFLEKFAVPEKSRLLLVTSCIYVPYQLMKFIPLAIEKNLYVDCIGVKPAVVMKEDKIVFLNNLALSKASNYLQEIKGSVNAIASLADLYREELKELS